MMHLRISEGFFLLRRMKFYFGSNYIVIQSFSMIDKDYNILLCKGEKILASETVIWKTKY